MASGGGTFAALQHRNYRYLWSGSLLSTTAFMMSFMLVPSVAFEITGSNASAGLAQMGSGFAMFLVSPIGGVIADRMAKKPIVFVGQAVPGFVILCTGLLIVTDHITVPLLTLATLIMGLGFSFMGPARGAWVGELVPRDSVGNGIALQSIAQNIAQVAAPLFVALLVGKVLSIGGAYLFMASLFVIVLPLTSRLPNTKPAEKAHRAIRSELVDGFQYVWGDLRLRTLWLGFVGLVVVGFAFQTLLPGLLDEELNRSATDIGPVFLAMAVAGLIFSLPLASVVRTAAAWPTLIGMGLLMVLAYVVMSNSTSYAMLVVSAIPLGIGRSGFMLMNNALLMSNANPAYYGRVMSLSMMGFGSQALLAPLWGLCADQIGVRPTLGIAGAMTALVIAAVGLMYLRIRKLPPPEFDTSRPSGPVASAPTEPPAEPVARFDSVADEDASRTLSG